MTTNAESRIAARAARGPQQRDLQAYLADIRATEPADGSSGVLIPGERGRACRSDRLHNGVPVADEVWKKLHILAGADAAAWRISGGV